MTAIHHSASAPPDPSGPMSEALARNWWIVLLRGLAAMLFGVIALFLPVLTLASLVLLFAVYMLADGALAIVSAVNAARRGERWGLFILEGLIDLAAGAAALLMPAAALFVFVVMAAAWGVVSGVLMLAAVFRLRRDHGRGWLVAGGLASILWGVLLVLFPAPGLVILTWWFGAYAFLFGASLIALSLTLRSRRAPEAPQAG